ncbi:MAG: hypothetical protein HY400_03580 [Elusimicrobia bacterium]|nr:hypothetical protein [Elusimicrobiota bacterium]
MIPLILKLFLHPRKAISEFDSGAHLWSGLGIYFFSLIVACFFYAHVPADLPSQFSEYFPVLEDSMFTPFFWLRLGFWEALFLILSLTFLWFFLRFFGRPGSFPGLVSFMAWLHLFYLLMFILMEIGLVLRSANFCFLTQMSISLWVVGIAVLGLKEMAGISIVKSFISLMMSTVLSAGSLFLFFRLHWLSASEMKILLLF